MRIGVSTTFASGNEGIGANLELPIHVFKFLELSPSFSFSRIKPNYKTNYTNRVYPNNPNSISFNGKSNELGKSNFNKSTNSQLGLDINLRFKPLSLLKKESRIDLALGFGYGYKSGIDLNEDSIDNGNYSISHRSWNSMEWNPILIDINYKLKEKLKIGLHFNSYGGNDGYDELGLHIISKL